MPLSYYIAQVFSGVAMGSLYGLLGIAMMFIYRSNRVFNFAICEFAAAVAFVAHALIKAGHPILAIPVSIGFGFLLGVSVELFVLKLVKDRRELSTIIVTVGLLAVMNSMMGWHFGYDPYSFPSLFPEGSFSFKDVIIPYQSVCDLVSALFISFLLFVFFKFTRLGIAFRAISEDPVAAKLKGIRVDHLVTLSWGISGAMAGIAGMLIARSLFLSPSSISGILFYAFAGTIVGGMQTSFGALVGGILVGVIESLATTSDRIGSDLKGACVFVVLVMFLMIRPRGLFGRDEPRKI